MFDLHLHLPLQGSQLDQTPKPWYGMICISKPSEWPQIIAFSQNRPDVTGAIGILPEMMDDTAGACVLDEMTERLENDIDLQIGEVGLDRRFQTTVPMDRQQEFLSKTLHLGYRLGRSVSLHVVQAEGPLFETLEQQRGKMPRLLWHGYTASMETAKRFIKLGGTISLGPSVWRPGLKLTQRLQELRDYPLAVETDWPGGWLPQEWRGLPYPDTLRNHMKRLATAMEIPIEQLEERTHAIGTLFTHQPTSWR